VPFLPQHTAAVGGTCTLTNGWILAKRLVYRSDRFINEANTGLCEAAVTGDFNLFWQSPNQKFLARLGVRDAFDSFPVQTTAEVNFRY